MSVSEVIQDISYKAAKCFITEGVSMNDTILKAAKELGLNSDTIDRICENANHLVNEIALIKQSNRYTDFELADPQRIKAAINVTEGISSVPYMKEPEPRVIEVYKEVPVKESNEKTVKAIEEDESLEEKIARKREYLGWENRKLTEAIEKRLLFLRDEYGIKTASLLFEKFAEELPPEIKDYFDVKLYDTNIFEKFTKEASEELYFTPDDELFISLKKLAKNCKEMELL